MRHKWKVKPTTSYRATCERCGMQTKHVSRKSKKAVSGRPKMLVTEQQFLINGIWKSAPLPICKSKKATAKPAAKKPTPTSAPAKKASRPRKTSTHVMLPDPISDPVAIADIVGDAAVGDGCDCGDDGCDCGGDDECNCKVDLS